MALTATFTSNHRLVSQNLLEESHLVRLQHFMQFLVIIVSKGAEIFDHHSILSISEAVGQLLLDAPSEKTLPLREVFMIFAAAVGQRHLNSGLRVPLLTFDFEAIWRICIGTTTTGNLILACKTLMAKWYHPTGLTQL